MTNIDRKEVVKIFSEYRQSGLVHRYNKVGRISARLAVPGEVIITSIDGEEETRNTAGNNSVVVTNPTGEQYILALDKFEKRYSWLSGVMTTADSAEYEAVGSCYAFQYSGLSFHFNAPWGEDMIVNDGDFIAVIDLDNLDDIYRIEQGAFAATYQKAE